MFEELNPPVARQLKKWVESGSEGREAATYEAMLKWVRTR